MTAEEHRRRGDAAMAKKPDSTAQPKPKEVVISLGEAEPDTLRPFGGSRSDRFNNALIDSTVNTGWFPTGMSDEDRARQLFVVVTALQAFKPADEIEGMIAAQAMPSVKRLRRRLGPLQVDISTAAGAAGGGRGGVSRGGGGDDARARAAISR